MTLAVSPQPRATTGCLGMGDTTVGALFGDERFAPLQRVVPVLAWHRGSQGVAVRAGSAMRCCRFVAPAGTRDLLSSWLLCTFSTCSGCGWDLLPFPLSPEELEIGFC